jgi:hypothetical protein
MQCITLLSDFGLQDAAVASVKGILLKHLPQVPLVDITHNVEPFHLQQGAYLMKASYPNFPVGTIHLQLIDVFYQKHPKMVLVYHNGHYFIGPDNGLFSMAFGNDRTEVWKGLELLAGATFADWLENAAKLIVRLQESPASNLGLEPCTLQNSIKNFSALVEADYIECQIIHIDRYENVIINLSRKQFDEVGRGRDFRIVFTRDEDINKISRHYTDVGHGQKLCRFNSAGYLEIAINRGKAAGLFGLRMGPNNNSIYHTVKIYFK